MISVCMATFNGEKYIGIQISSILNQIGENDEVIISDDGSTDGTLDLISSLKDPRIKVIQHKRSWLPEDMPIISRVRCNFDCALRLAKGKCIFLADQDDEWLPGRVDAALEQLKNGYDLTVSNCVVVDEENNVIFSSYYDLIKPSKSLLRTISKSSFHGCCMAFNSSMLKHILPFPDKNIGHDTWIGMVICTKGRIKFLQNKYIKYFRHENTVTQCGFKSNRPLLVKIKYRLDLIYSIFMRAIVNG